MKYVIWGFLFFLPFKGLTFDFAPFPLEENLPCGVYFLPSQSKVQPKSSPKNLLKATKDSEGLFENYLANKIHETVEEDFLILQKSKRTPLLNSIKLYCSDDFFKGKDIRKVTKGEWLDCLVQMSALVKKREGEGLLFSLLQSTFHESLTKWKLDPASFRQSNTGHPLGLDQEVITLVPHYQGKVNSKLHLLRINLYQSKGVIISKETIEEYKKQMSGPLPASLSVEEEDKD